MRNIRWQTLAQLELLSFYLVNLFLHSLSLHHLHPPLPLSSLHVHLAVRLGFVCTADTADRTGQVFSVSSRPVSEVRAVGGTEKRKEGADRRRAGSSSSACGRSLTDFLTSHRYIDSHCHLGSFSDVQSSGTWGWWLGFDWLCVFPRCLNTNSILGRSFRWQHGHSLCQHLCQCLLLD